MLAYLALGIWLYLCLFHGGFWLSTPELPPAVPSGLPDVDVVVPARDEAATIGRVVASLAVQDYAGSVRILLIDDGSSDGTAAIARAAIPPAAAARFDVLAAGPKPADWSGKLWAVSRGVAHGRAPLLLFADADIEHDPRHLAALVARLDAPRVDMVSEMVRLNCESFAERALVPAFVYFFQMLYPFARVNDPGSRMAAAAGGTVLIRRTALERIGGIAAIRGALIDDVALAKAVKQGGAIYLGHSGLAASIRPYPRAADIWHMITRTAFTQLHYSFVLLVFTVLALTLVWGVPIGAALAAHGAQRLCGWAAFALGCASFIPTLRRYKRNRLWCLALPLIALFYMAATVASAVGYWFGHGARWKNRDYGPGSRAG